MIWNEMSRQKHDFCKCFVTSKQQIFLIFTINSSWFEIDSTYYFVAIYSSRISILRWIDFFKISILKFRFDTKWSIVKFHVKIVKSHINVNNNFSMIFHIVNSTSIVTIKTTTLNFHRKRLSTINFVKFI